LQDFLLAASSFPTTHVSVVRADCTDSRSMAP
jgi:hypothetical protein